MRRLAETYNDWAEQLQDKIKNGFEFSNTPPSKEWVIQGVLPEGISILYGAHSAGKSFVALSMAGAIITGKPWLGKYRIPNAGPVVYLSMEGGKGDFASRWYAYRKQHGLLVPNTDQD